MHLIIIYVLLNHTFCVRVENFNEFLFIKLPCSLENWIELGRLTKNDDDSRVINQTKSEDIVSKKTKINYQKKRSIIILINAGVQ